MEQEEKLKKVCDNFLLLNDKQQEYILGILQALVFAKNDGGNSGSGQTSSKSNDSN